MIISPEWAAHQEGVIPVASKPAQDKLSCPQGRNRAHTTRIAGEYPMGVRICHTLLMLGPPTTHHSWPVKPTCHLTHRHVPALVSRRTQTLHTYVQHARIHVAPLVYFKAGILFAPRLILIIEYANYCTNVSVGRLRCYGNRSFVPRTDLAVIKIGRYGKSGTFQCFQCLDQGSIVDDWIEDLLSTPSWVAFAPRPVRVFARRI